MNSLAMLNVVDISLTQSWFEFIKEGGTCSTDKQLDHVFAATPTAQCCHVAVQR
ncbi:hypothetical protein [Vibrio lentus]|uniref:hypothetical protein n=1 Tax=Vibrio lentus TaxID=136468 RepID=UPI001CEFF7DE|nr:hypothetical protein [Vibrio lentus]MDN3628463.1 hypothetical protein [Vibrio lentus]